MLLNHSTSLLYLHKLSPPPTKFFSHFKHSYSLLLSNPSPSPPPPLLPSCPSFSLPRVSFFCLNPPRQRQAKPFATANAATAKRKETDTFFTHEDVSWASLGCPISFLGLSIVPASIGPLWFSGASEKSPIKLFQIDPHWKACGNGKMQSPIDLLDCRVQVFPSLGKSMRDYQPAPAVMKTRRHDNMLLDLSSVDLISKGNACISSRRNAADNFLNKDLDFIGAKSFVAHWHCLELLYTCNEAYGGGGSPSSSSFIITMDEYNQWLSVNSSTNRKLVLVPKDKARIEKRCEAIVAWVERLFRNNPPNMNLRIESDAEIVVKFLTGEVGCNDVNLIEFKRKFVPYNSKVIWINEELNGIAHSLAQYACECQSLKSLNHSTGTALKTTRRDEVWDYENGFPVGLIATILEDYGRRMVKVKFGCNNIVDTGSILCYEVPLLRMTEDMDKKGDQKEEIEESHGGIGRGFDNSYFWGFAEKNQTEKWFSHQSSSLSLLSPSSSPSLPYNTAYQKQPSPSSSSGNFSQNIDLHHQSVNQIDTQRFLSLMLSRDNCNNPYNFLDSDLDQAFIDAVPTFLYKEIMGLKEPFDCAAHGYYLIQLALFVEGTFTHLGLLGFPLKTQFFVLRTQGKKMSFQAMGQLGFFLVKKPAENAIISEKSVFSVGLGKFRSSNDGVGAVVERRVGETSSSSLDARCYSLGSYQYVVADSELQVALCPNRVGGSMRIVKGRGTKWDFYN
ncbi:ring-h2 finger protein atl47 [Quercus suber]|uniref:RING-type E3 ubiquitin transferase n=1 Tax=Quercus suber TaxID=58331 RepID=A0AAW0KMJ9_QUESU